MQMRMMGCGYAAGAEVAVVAVVAVIAVARWIVFWGGPDGLAFWFQLAPVGTEEDSRRG